MKPEPPWLKFAETLFLVTRKLYAIHHSYIIPTPKFTLTSFLYKYLLENIVCFHKLCPIFLELRTFIVSDLKFLNIRGNHIKS